MISIFLVWPMFVRKNWPSLTHVEAIEHFNVLYHVCQIFCACVSTVSQSDCYVRLWLPTASDEIFHTKTIKNCRNPVWNETFYFRIQRKVKVNSPNLSFSSYFYAVFQFNPQPLMSSGAFLGLLKIPHTSWSKTILALLESNLLLTDYYLCMGNGSLTLGKADGSHDSDNTEKLKWKYTGTEHHVFFWKDMK